eukprot:TRINITY_DN33700_c0_g1_i1.p1 TRINITY_DN33700_c0_g1~~TRINITY_DN33700_c0_g1_i1.p1  ORF type:complete len:246 (-),score=22.98 TRINITY_DN33700_c0_g1_i1:249-929(-)
MAGLRVQAWLTSRASASKQSGEMVSTKEVLKQIVGLLASSQISVAMNTLHNLISKDSIDMPFIDAAQWDAVCERSRRQSVVVDSTKTHGWALPHRHKSRSAHHRSEQASGTGTRMPSLFGNARSVSNGAATTGPNAVSRSGSRCDREEVEDFSWVLPDQVRCRSPEPMEGDVVLSRYRDGTKTNPVDVETIARDRADVPHAPMDRLEEDESAVRDGWKRLPHLRSG